MGDDTGIDHRDGDPVRAGRHVPRRRQIDAAGSLVVVPLLREIGVVRDGHRPQHQVRLDREQVGIAPQQTGRLARLGPHHPACQPDHVGAARHGAQVLETLAEAAAERSEARPRVGRRVTQPNDEAVGLIGIDGRFRDDRTRNVGTSSARRRNGAGERGGEGKDEESVHGRLHQTWRPTCRRRAAFAAAQAVRNCPAAGRPRPQASVTVLRSLRWVDASPNPAPALATRATQRGAGAPTRTGRSPRRPRRSATPRRPAAGCAASRAQRCSSAAGDALPFVAEHPGARPRQRRRVQRLRRHASWSPAAARASASSAARPSPSTSCSAKCAPMPARSTLGDHSAAVPLSAITCAKPNAAALRRMLPTLPASCSRSSTTLGASARTRRRRRPWRRRSRSAPAMSSALRPRHQRVGDDARRCRARSASARSAGVCPGRLADQRLRRRRRRASTQAAHRCSPSSQTCAELAVGAGSSRQLAQPHAAAGCRAS